MDPGDPWEEAGPSFVCSCTSLPPTDRKLKIVVIFPVAMLLQRDPPPHLLRQPTAPKPPNSLSL